MGSVAFSSLLADEVTANPMAPKKPMTPAKAKNVIMLFMEGGPGHMDTFDPKPKLTQLHKTESKNDRGLAAGNYQFYVGSPFKFKKAGQSGMDMCDQWKYMSDPEVADELCNYRGCQAESLNHPEALFHMNTGSRLGADPSLGAWATYGLGSENQNLPGYVVMTEMALPQGGSKNWSNGFLPAHFQGTALRPKGSPLLNLESQPFKSRAHQRAALDQLAFLNDQHAKRHPEHADLTARMESYELAYRMQMEVPEVVDLEGEPEYIREMYGMDNKVTHDFGRQCLIARHLAEAGVRFIEVGMGGWDHHRNLREDLPAKCREIDKPIAALLADLARSGMLEETLVVWSGEFGRTPYAQNGDGRDHNNRGFTSWMAGGGVKGGFSHGATDENGIEAVEGRLSIHDWHATILHVMGLDHEALTYPYAGRDFRLTDVHGEVARDILA